MLPLVHAINTLPCPNTRTVRVHRVISGTQAAQRGLRRRIRGAIPGEAQGRRPVCMLPSSRGAVIAAPSSNHELPVAVKSAADVGGVCKIGMDAGMPLGMYVSWAS